MAFEGNVLYRCDTEWSYYSNVFLITVSGSAGNFCGHALVYFSNGSSKIARGIYMHIAGGLNARPKTLTNEEYNRYLQENKKSELKREKLFVPNVMKSVLKAERLTSKKWFWGGIAHNCYSFAEELVAAGGGKINKVFNCPRW
jgi:hypothetical protein